MACEHNSVVSGDTKRPHQKHRIILITRSRRIGGDGYEYLTGANVYCEE